MQMGPMIQQSIQHCSNCKGIGKMIEHGKHCIKCNGNKTMTLKKHLDCYVRPGSAPGTSISFKNESDWVPDCSDIGDLIVFVNCKNDEGIFRREGNNLIMKKTITLLEALTKTVFYFKHLDDRVIRITHNEIIKPNQKMLVKDEGMPNINSGHGNDNGDLLIYFDITFPDTLEQDRSKYLVKILPLPKKQIWDLQLESVPDNNVTDKVMYNYTDDKTKSNTQPHETIFSDINNVVDDDDLFNDNDNDNSNGNRMPNMGGRQVECATQ